MIVALLLVVFVLGFLQSIIAAWATSHVWEWFCTDIAPNPGLWAWFGVFAIINMVFALNNSTPPEKTDGGPFTAICVKAGSTCVGFALGVGMLWCFGRLVGVI